MKKSEILSIDWRRKAEVTTISPSVLIRELSSAARKSIIDQSAAMRAEKNDAEANEFFVQEFCFQSIIDEDNEVVYETEDERKHAIKTLPLSWFGEVFSAVSSMNDLLPSAKGEDEKDAMKKKSSTGTAECPQPNFDGTTDSAESSDS